MRFKKVEDRASQVLSYVGITNDFGRRLVEHSKRDFLPKEVLDGLTRRKARAVEEAMINAHGLGKGSWLENKIHSIAMRRPIYKEAVGWGEQYLRDQGRGDLLVKGITKEESGL